jgi:hypothetical protein
MPDDFTNENDRELDGLRKKYDGFKKHNMGEQIKKLRELSETHGTDNIKALLEKLETVHETLTDEYP